MRIHVSEYFVSVPRLGRAAYFCICVAFALPAPALAAQPYSATIWRTMIPSPRDEMAHPETVRVEVSRDASGVTTCALYRKTPGTSHDTSGLLLATSTLPKGVTECYTPPMEPSMTGCR